jgi:hypothetical protein
MIHFLASCNVCANQEVNQRQAREVKRSITWSVETMTESSEKNALFVHSGDSLIRRNPFMPDRGLINRPQNL